MILIAIGTRPEMIKVEPLIKEFKKEKIPFRVLHVAQHPDLGIKADFTISIITYADRLSNIIASVQRELSDILFENDITHVLVQGDTTTAFAVALSAFNNKVKVIHLEAGLRTYDNENPWPEEANRRMISMITDVHLCPTQEDADNLDVEWAQGEVYVTGNTVIDSLVKYKDKCRYDNLVLVTMHRRENHERMREWFEAIEMLAEYNREYEFILPLHPNPAVSKHRDVFDIVNVVDPLPHDEFLNLLVRCKLVITDSGGLQEECSYLNKKCLVCRGTTERKATLGVSSFLIQSPVLLESAFNLHINSFKLDLESPYGEGNSAEIIVKILKNEAILDRDR